MAGQAETGWKKDEMTKREWWRDEVAPVADRLEALYGEIIEAVALMRPEDRLQLRIAASLAGQTNCSWMEHRAAALIIDALPSMDGLLREAGRVPDYVHKDRQGNVCGVKSYHSSYRWADVTCPKCLAERSGSGVAKRVELLQPGR
jgi:hypothetical protein